MSYELVDIIYEGLIKFLQKMKLIIKQTLNLIFFIFMSNTQFLQSHDSFNGDCKDHCIESVDFLTVEKELNIISNKNHFSDNDSCLNKSLCRG